MDGSPAANAVMELAPYARFARFVAAFIFVLGMRAPVRADVSVHGCAAELANTFTALLELELPAETRSEVDVSLTCDAQRAVVQVKTEQRKIDRSIALGTEDAGRWLALAAAELVGLAREAAPQTLSVQTPVSEPRPRPWSLRLAARARLGDEPVMLRAGGELGIGLAISRPVWLAATLRFSSGTRAVEGPVRVRATDASLALTAGYAFHAQRFCLLPGLGIVGGAARLDADSSSAKLEARSLTRGFVGPMAWIRAQWLMHARAALELSLEAAYALPSIEGRNESRRVLFKQTPWYSATSLGVSFTL